MQEVIRFVFPEGARREQVEGDVALAVFSAECLYGRPRTRLEVSYLLNADGSRCAMRVRGPAGETAIRVLTGLCGERFGEDGFQVEHLSDADEVSE